MHHPFADLIGLTIEEQRAGFSRCVLQADEHHLNPHRVVQGAVIDALAATGLSLSPGSNGMLASTCGAPHGPPLLFGGALRLPAVMALFGTGAVLPLQG